MPSKSVKRAPYSAQWLVNELSIDSKSPPSTPDSVLWTDIYEPKNEQELAIHKAKIRELSDEIYQTLSNERQQFGGSILLVTGPPGCGKTITLRTILHSNCSGKLKCTDIKEWNEETVDSDDITSLEDFIYQTARYNDVTRCGEETSHPVVLILKTFPASLASCLPRFHQLLKWHTRRARPNCLLVLVITLSCSAREELLPERLLCPPFLRNELGVRKVEFNPVAPSLIVKALNRILSFQAQQSGRGKNVSTGKSLLHFASECCGDLRTAINQLQFHMKLSTDRKRTVDRSENDGVCHFRDTGLHLFNAIGKILYCKRLTDDHKRANLPPDYPLPDHLSSWKRSPLAFNIEEVLEQCQLDGSSLVTWLHENFVDFLPHFEAVHFCSDHISWSEAALSGGMNWRLGLTPAATASEASGYRRNPLRAVNDYVALVVSRSLLLAHELPGAVGQSATTPVSSRLRPMRSPRLHWQLARGSADSWCDGLLDSLASVESADNDQLTNPTVSTLFVAHLAIAGRARLLLDWLPVASREGMPTYSYLASSDVLGAIAELCSFGKSATNTSQFHSRNRTVQQRKPEAPNNTDSLVTSWICPPEAAREGSELPIDEDED